MSEIDKSDTASRFNTLRRRRVGSLVAVAVLVLLIIDGRIERWSEPIGVLLALLIPALLVYGLVLSVQIRRELKSVPAKPTVPAGLTLSNTLTIAFLVYVFDALITSQGAIAILVCFVFFLWMIPSTLIAARKDKVLGMFRAKKAFIMLIMVLAVFGTVAINVRLAAHRADRVVDAIKQYEAKYGKYPQRLEEVAPEFIPSIPRPKLALTNSPTSHGGTFMPWGMSLCLPKEEDPTCSRGVDGMVHYRFQSHLCRSELRAFRKGFRFAGM
jgi:hypothetical protein